jgi:hypothetical protein
MMVLYQLDSATYRFEDRDGCGLIVLGEYDGGACHCKERCCMEE